jgi:hypothetical protein
VDPTDVRSFQPGKVIMVKDPEADIKWDRPPDVTGSSYQEQDRVNLDFDDLTGDVSMAATQGRGQIDQTVGNMSMMAGNASQIGEYEQRTFAETFAEPLLEQLVKLEQAYETDPVILATAGRKAQLLQKFGMNAITDELLQQQLTVKVNIGLGATNPKMKLQNFLTATQAIGQIYGPAAALNSNPLEIIKEVFGLCGYKDGDRFFLPGSDIHQTMIQIQQSQAAGKHGKSPQQDAHEEAMAQQAEQQRQQMEHQNTMQELQQKYTLEEKKMMLEAQLKEREFQHQVNMDHQKLQYEQQFKQAGLADQQRQRQEMMSHQLRLKNGAAPEDRQNEINQVVQTISQLMGKSHEHHQALHGAISNLTKAQKAKRRTRGVRDHKGNIIGSESYTVDDQRV